MEEGSTYIDAVKVKAHNIAELSEICKAVIEAGKPYKFIVLDTITALEEMSKPLAAKLYMATPMGKNYQGGGEGILALPSGGGYLWMRNAIEKVIDMVSKCAENIILVGHVKDKAIIDSEGKEQGSLKDFDMTGKWHYLSTDQFDNLEHDGLFSNKISKKLKIDQYIIDLYFIEKHIDKINSTTYNIDMVVDMLHKRHNGISLKDLSRNTKEMSCTPKRLFDSLNIKFNFKWLHAEDVITENICLEIIEKFKSGKPIYKIAQDYQLNESLISDFLHKKLSDNILAGFNIHYFDQIDTEDKAYWLGFLYADGNVSDRGSVNVDLQSSDLIHLKKFQSCIESKSNPRLQITRKYNRSRFGVANRHFSEMLVLHGCMPRKSLILKFPTFLSDDLLRHFIRGYFDGDGSLSYSNTNPGVSERITIACSMVGTLNFVSDVNLYLNKLGIHGCISKNHNSKNIYALGFSKTNSVKFANFIYSNCQTFLDRKFRRYQFFLDNNFAVQKSDFLNNDRAISEEVKHWMKENVNKNFSLVTNSEITFLKYSNA